MRLTYIEKKFLKDTQNEIKALVFKTNTSVLGMSDFHIPLRMVAVREESEDSPFIPMNNYIELTPNNDYHLKLPIKG